MVVFWSSLDVELDFQLLGKNPELKIVFPKTPIAQFNKQDLPSSDQKPDSYCQAQAQALTHHP